MIPESFIDRIKDSADIERIISSYVSLKRRGRTLVGCCPFHSEKTASFTVYPDNDAHFYCFGCQKGGDVITFIREIENLEYVDAVRFLAEKAGLPMPEDTADDGAARRKARVYELNRTAARFFHQNLISPSGKDALEYLTGRGLLPKTIRRFGLGYAPDSWNSLSGYLGGEGFSEDEMLAAFVCSRGRNGKIYDMFRGRVIFPIIDLRGNVVGFGGRAMSDSGPKYLNSSDTPVFKKSKNLYALNFAKAAKSDMLLLAEGYMDVIALHQAGFPYTVATLGTALTQEQARLISQYAGRVAIAYDSDRAGQNAAKRAINIFSQIDVAVSVLDMQGAKDPDEYIQKFGAQRFRGLIDSGKSAMTFEIDKLKAKHDLDTPEGKTAFLSDFCSLMADIASDLQRDVYISEISRELGVGKDRVMATAQAIRKKRAGTILRREAHNLRAYVQDNPGTARSRGVKEEISGLVAERGLISMLMRNPDYYDDIRSKITHEDFITPDYAEIFKALAVQLEQNKAPELIHMGAHLTPGQMSLLSGMAAAGREIPYYREQADEFVGAIKAAKTQKSPEELGNMSPRQLAEYIDSRRKSKL